MELTSDIRSKLGDEPSSHMSKVGTVVPQLADMALASRRDFLSLPQVFEDQPCRDWKHLTGMTLLHTGSKFTPGDHQMMEKPDCFPMVPKNKSKKY